MNITSKTREDIAEIANPRVRQKWQRFLTIPADLQTAMFDPPVAEKIWDIVSEKNGLGDENVSPVAKIIGLIFLGELPIKNFIVALKNELGIDNEKAAAVAQDINQAIFQPVRESLMQVHNINPKIPNNQSGSTQYQSPQNNTGQSREELLARLRSQNTSPQMTPPPTPTQRQPFQARPAQYYYAPNRNIIDLRVKKRKNSNTKKKYKGFFASY